MAAVPEVAQSGPQSGQPGLDTWLSRAALGISEKL
jgi:hypothetical protein